VCLDGAACGLTCRFAVVIMARNIQMWRVACGGWLPVWLPESRKRRLPVRHAAGQAARPAGSRIGKRCRRGPASAPRSPPESSRSRAEWLRGTVAKRERQHAALV
jgi:hypothetical protein